MGNILKNPFGEVIPVSKAFTLLSASIRHPTLPQGRGKLNVELDGMIPIFF
jgi:hypothetical protein